MFLITLCNPNRIKPDQSNQSVSTSYSESGELNKSVPGLGFRQGLRNCTNLAARDEMTQNPSLPQAPSRLAREHTTCRTLETFQMSRLKRNQPNQVNQANQSVPGKSLKTQTESGESGESECSWEIIENSNRINRIR